MSRRYEYTDFITGEKFKAKRGYSELHEGFCQHEDEIVGSTYAITIDYSHVTGKGTVRPEKCWCGKKYQLIRGEE